MNLEAQIQLITVPQEFARLCNGVLDADYGDDFLPIDDDRPDRGNDGYLKSEKKSSPPIASSESRIRAWISGEAGIDVSWRGPDYLARGLREHEHVREAFPDLYVAKISTQLEELRVAVAPVEHQSTTEQYFDIPRSPSERDALLSTKPPGWEYLLWAGLLWEGRESLTMKWHDHELEIARGEPIELDRDAALEYSGAAMRKLRLQLQPAVRVFEPDAQELAFGRLGEPGDPIRIEHFAGHFNQTYEYMLDWAAEIRVVEPPDNMARLFELMPHVADKPLATFRSFVSDVIRETSRIPDHIRSEPQKPLNLSLDLVLDLDDTIMSQMIRELERIGDSP